MKTRKTPSRAAAKLRNPHARSLVRLGHGVVPSKRAYSRKGRRAARASGQATAETNPGGFDG